MLRGEASPPEAAAPGARTDVHERLGRTGTPTLVTHSISCTDEEWEQIRERAARAGKSMSDYLVERARSARLSDAEASRPAPRLTLDEADQRTLFESVERPIARRCIVTR